MQMPQASPAAEKADQQHNPTQDTGSQASPLTGPSTARA